jgi:uncharacterized protein (TIGR00251 family)
MPVQKMETRITVRVQPNASRNEVVAITGDILKIKIAAPPVEGKANRRLIEFLSERLNVSKSRLSVLKGENGRNKVIAIEGLDRAEVLRRLSAL